MLVLISGCEGTGGLFYISDEARKYQADTTVISFKMADNFGITEEFYMDNYWYTPHHYFTEWGNGGDAYGETYGIAYRSVLNDYFFMLVLRAGVGYTDLEVEWNQNAQMVYNFSTGKVTTGLIPEILFYDSLVVMDVVYNNIIEIDYTGKINDIDENTPVKTYISGDKGLIKFIRKDGVITERIPTF